MAVPYTFAAATASIPLSQLDSNFATTITLGNTAIQLGNTVSTLNNMTFANVTISSVATAFPNNFLANSTTTLGNATLTLGSTTTSVGNLTLANVTISSVATPITAAQGGTGLTTITSNAVLIGNATGSLTTVSPGNSGNVLASNGTAWVSQAPGAATGNVTIGNTTISLGGTSASLGNTTFNNCSVGNAVVDSVNITGFMGIPQNSQNGNYNVVLGDAGKHIYHPAGQAAATYTIPANTNVAFTVGTTISFVNLSANAATIAVTTDTIYLASTGSTGNRTLAQYGVATAVKITSTSWIISGTALT